MVLKLAPGAKRRKTGPNVSGPETAWTPPADGRFALGKVLERTWACGKCREHWKRARRKLRLESDGGGAPEGPLCEPSEEPPTTFAVANSGGGPSVGAAKPRATP